MRNNVSGRRRARAVVAVTSLTAAGLVMQVGGAGNALAEDGIGGVTVNVVEVRAAIDGGSADAGAYAQAISDLSTAALKIGPMFSATFDPGTGELITEVGTTPSMAIGVPGVGVPAVVPFTRRIPNVSSPVDWVSVDASDASSIAETVIADPSTVTLEYSIAVSNDVVAVDTADADPGGTDGSCNPTGEGLIQHEPLSSAETTQNFYADYTLVPYERPAAHMRPSGEMTYQIALCAFGNSKVINGNRLLREGMGITAWSGDGDQKFRIGQAYDTSVQDGISSGEVNFSLDFGSAKVGASIGTTAVGKNLGSMGIPGPTKERDAAAKWSLPNVVEAWWDHNSSWQVPWRNRGSRSPQATIAEGLYEFTYSIKTFNYGFQPYLEYRCTAYDSCPISVAR